MQYRILSLLTLTAIATTFSGCRTKDLQAWTGTYGGTLLYQKIDGSYAKKSVSGVVSIDDKSKTVSLKLDEAGVEVGSATILIQKQTQVRIESTFSALSDIVLTSEPDGLCFVASSAEEIVHMCPEDAQWSIDASTAAGDPIFSLLITKGTSAPPEMLAAPKTYTLDEALAIARDHAFESRISYLTLLQARLQAKQAQLDLLPHLTINSVVALLMPFNIPNFLTGVADLVPFLFPDRRAKATSAKEQVEAEKDASVLTKLDIVSQVEEVAILDRIQHKATLKIEQLDAKIQDYLAEIKIRERLGEYPAGTWEGFKIIDLGLQSDLSFYAESEKALYRQASVALGFSNLDAVTGITYNGELLDVDHLPNYDESTEVTIAVARSFELHQMDMVIESASTNQKGASYSWMDFNVGISAGHWKGVQAGRVQVAELQVRRQELEAKIQQQVADLVGQWDLAIKNRKLLLQAQAEQITRLDKLKIQYKYGKDVSVMDLVNAVQETNRAELSVLNANGALELLDSKIRRATLGANYVTATI
jgi:hypothetical protein